MKEDIKYTVQTEIDNDGDLMYHGTVVKYPKIVEDFFKKCEKEIEKKLKEYSQLNGEEELKKNLNVLYLKYMKEETSKLEKETGYTMEDLSPHHN